MNKLKERVLAYIIDMIIVSLVFSLITVFFSTSSNYKKLNNELEEVTNDFLEQKIDTVTYINKQADISHDMDKEIIMFNVLNGFILVGYFVILPYYYNGQTLGKKLLKIKIESKDGSLTLNQLIIRALIIDGLGSLIILLSLVYVLTGLPYFIVTSCLNLIEVVLTIVSVVFIIKRDDHRAIHDLLSGTEVI